MPVLDSQLKECYRDKRECVIGFPESLLPSSKVEEYRAMPRLAIVEIAGRDSVAAAVKAVEGEGFSDLLPTYVYTGTEHGPWSGVNDAVERLSGRLPKIRVHDLLVFGSPGFWQALNGRFINELIAKFGFFTPCIGCHLYLHSVRIPLALTLGKVPIISGERESHDGSIKINQVSEALTVYQEMAREFGIRLLFPLRHISEGNRVRNILGFEWEEGKEQLGCVLSGNYRRLDGTVNITGGEALKYFEKFAYPLTREIIETYVAGQAPSHLEAAARFLGF